VKRIVYLTQRFPVVTETFTLNEVIGLRKRGLDVVVRALRPAPADLPPSLEAFHAEAELLSLRPTRRGIAQCLSPTALRHRPRHRVVAALRGGALASAIDPQGDHVHTQFPLEAASVGLFTARCSHASFSFSGHTYHDLDLMPEKLAAASFVVVGSEFEGELLRRRYGGGSSDRVHLRRLGVPQRPRRLEAARGLVVSVGTLAGKKGHDVLIRAFAELVGRSGEGNRRLEIIGAGPERSALEALAGSLGVAERVSFPGALGHDEALERIGRAEAFALCCRKTAEGDHDCLPVSLMDAMSVGVPCVSSAAFGIAELIEHGRSGLLGPPADHLAAAHHLTAILEDVALRDRLGDAGLELVRERYDLDRNLDALAALFTSQLAS
jgi:glycosyltransferase involved in cell wall biosynthesis